MKLDTSSYYPKSHLDDDGDDSPVFSESTAADSSPESCPEPSSEAVHEPDLPPSELEAGITQLSHFLSWVLVPLLMPVYGIMLAFGLSILSFTDFSVRLTFTAIVLGFNVVIPSLLVLLLKKLGLVQDVGLNGQQERFIPYIVCIACLIGTALFMHFKGAPTWLFMFFFGGAAAGIIEVIVNRWWKISVHAAGIAGIVALLLRMFMAGDYMSPATQWWLIVSVGLAGMLGSARIWLGRHTLMQVLAGYAVGFCSVFFMMSF